MKRAMTVTNLPNWTKQNLTGSQKPERKEEIRHPFSLDESKAVLKEGAASLNILIAMSWWRRFHGFAAITTPTRLIPLN